MKHSIDTFWALVDRTNEAGCWPWRGYFGRAMRDECRQIAAMAIRMMVDVCQEANDESPPLEEV